MVGAHLRCSAKEINCKEDSISFCESLIFSAFCESRWSSLTFRRRRFVLGGVEIWLLMSESVSLQLLTASSFLNGEKEIL